MLGWRGSRDKNVILSDRNYLNKDFNDIQSLFFKTIIKLQY